jgi:hypothetical protein
MEGFGGLIEKKWQEVKCKCPPRVYSIDVWHGAIAELRRFFKGWGTNIRG